MKRLLSFIMAFAMVLTMLPMTALAADTDTTVYLVPNSNWTQANARFALYYWNSSGSYWTDMTDTDGDGYYEAVVPAGYTNIIFCRMNPSNTANSWDTKWNQTADLTLPTDGTNCYTVASGTWDKGGGTWSAYTPEPEEEETTAPTEAEEETVTVYFRNDWLWPEVYVHYWNDSQGTIWPGEVMTFVETTDAGDIYTAEIPTWATALLFNGLENNNPSNRQQTPDIAGFADGDAYYIHWDGENKASKFDYTPSTGGEETDPTDPPTAEATYIIAGTAALCGTAWDPANTANTMTLNADGLYEKTYESVAAGTHSFKVTDGTWNNSWGGSGTDGNYEFTLDAISNVTITFNAGTKAIAISSEATGEVAESVEWATIHYRNTGMWTTVNGYSWYSGTSTTLLGGWPGTAIEENAAHPNWYTVELTDLAENAGVGILFNNGTSQTGDIMIESSGEYWYDGALLTEAPATWEDGSVQNVEYEVTLHFANTPGWGSVNLYTWTAAGTPTGSWPGTACGLDSDGFYSLRFTYEAPEGQGLNFIFSGSGQTVDLALAASDFVDNKAEKWVVPTTTDGEGKYYADIVASPDAIAISPVVSGTSVTFEYKGNTTDTVEVYGSMNNWTSGYAMTCNDYGVWSVTLNDVGYGIQQYKFVVNGSWILDPLNSFVITEDSGNQNSAFLISNPELDTNTVKVNVHFDAPSAEWNVCAWGAPGLEAQYDFTDGVTTITLDGRASQYVAFKVRRSIEGNDWAEQSGEIRVDLGNIVSGTIDVWVGSGFSVSQSLNDDVVYANKVKSVELDYDNNTVIIQTSQAVEDAETAFAIYKDGEVADIIESVSVSGSTYTLTLTEEMDLVTLYQYTLRFSEQVKFTDHDYVIGINTVYASDKFAAQFTYEGDDLGATWSEASTTFVVWAPTAASVSVNLYTSGTEGTDDLIQSVPMSAINDGAWMAAVEGDLNGTYYTYAVNVDGETVEAVDPYARTTGVNGKRGMVIDLDSTAPDGWDEDTNPNPITSYIDAIIYELHVRDFSIDDSSGVSEANRGKYLAFTEQGTTTANGAVTGIDYLESLGVTHLHLLPVYDYGSVDETKCDTFNWGYDPVNYNVPEGSYSTDPYNGATRVNEFKQMVMALHDADISVIMDVVYNHVYDAGKFCMNQIVPNYFSRVNADGSFSNGSGCGNDTASEREMVRKYIVESVLYWHQEYHIDGFRFDLVGLLDADTINQIVEEVHACCPDVIFYGEGWTLGTAVEPGNTMATQANASATPEFAYFSDTIRNLLAGSNGTSLGFVSGQTGQEEAIRDNFMASPWWSNDPSQIVQYASCHDNYTLIDKLVLSTGKSGIDADIIRMNNLAAAIYMTSQGIPFIHAGEEFLREKLEEDGGRCENSYNASDYVNHIEWSNLENETYAANSDYYKGLIAFRKAHEALRMESNADIVSNIDYTWVTNEVVMFTIDGVAAGDISDSIVVIFNATNSAKTVTLPTGEWSVCINATQAGTDVIETVTSSVSVDGISAMVLVQGENEPGHVHDWEDGTCGGCGEVCAHTFTDGVCTVCGMTCAHAWNGDYCPNCGTYCGHDWVDGTCAVCGMVCDHGHHWQNGLCSSCLAEVEHVYSENGLCTCGKSNCDHESHNVNGMCDACGLAVGHTVGADGICTVCSYNQNLMAFLAGTMNGWSTSANALQSIGGTKVAGSVYLTAGTYQFKIVYNDAWKGNGGTIDSTASGWVMDSDANCTLNAQYDGMYTFVYDTGANTLDVYSKITAKLYLRGTFNDWGTDTVLNYSGGTVQTASVTLLAGTYEFKVGNDDWTFGTPAANISATLDQKSVLTVTAAYNGDGTWTVTWEAEEVYKDATALENFEYTLDAETGTVTLTKYIGTGAAVVVAPIYAVDGVTYTTVLDTATVFRDNTTITSAKLYDGVKFKDNTMTRLFSGCSKLVSADLGGVNTTGVTDMSFLFTNCTALTSVDMTGLDTSAVTTMYGMFSYCKKLASIAGYEDWDTSSLQVMRHMFNYVQALDVVDLSKWDLSQMINSAWCFQYCYASQILLPDNLKTISAGFLNHARMYEGTTFTIPVGVEKIGYAHTIYDFSDDDFVEFIVAEGNENYVAIDGILYSADGREMLAVPRGKTFENNTYVIPEGVDFLGELSFSRNYNIHTVVLPNSYELEYVPLYDPRYILVDDTGNLNAGLNLNIAIYCYTGITDYAVKDDNPRYASIDGIIYSKDMSTVVAIPSRYNKFMDIPEGVTAWDYEAMWADNSWTVDGLMSNCTGVSIPSTMTEISQDQIDKLNRLNKRFAGFEIVVHEDNPVYGVDADGYLIIKGEAVARNTATRTAYTTVAEALADAKSGETVILLTDCAEERVLVIPGVTLDLNGHTLTAGYVVGFNTSAVCDSSNSAENEYQPQGLLVVDPDNLVLYEGNGTVPVYSPVKGGYIFVDFLFNSSVVKGEGTATVNMLVTSRTLEVIDLLRDGAADNDIQIAVRLTWNNATGTAYQDFVFNEDTICNVMQSNKGTALDFGRMFYVNVTGLDSLEGVTATAMVIAGCNAVDSGAMMNVK